MKKSIFRLTSIAVLFLLLLSPSLSLEGAQNGLTLWATVVLPTLLPFMICSNMIVALDGIPLLIFPFRYILRKWFLLSDSGAYILLSGLLCGYPMGARGCSDFLDEGRITKREGRYLLALCNQSSPMFLLGFAAAALPVHIPAWCLCLSIYLPLLPLAFIARKIYGISQCPESLNPVALSLKSFDEMMMDCFDVMVKICGYIMLFSILVLYITKLPMLEAGHKAILMGFVEITTGIKNLSLSVSGLERGMWIAAATSFGGFSGIYQTKSVIKNAGLSIRHYMLWKAVHGLLSAIIFILLVCSFLPQVAVR